MQESHSVDWRFWHESICVKVPAHRRSQLGCNLSKYEDFCMPQTNEVRTRFDLLTSFRQGNHSVDEWYTIV